MRYGRFNVCFSNYFVVEMCIKNDNKLRGCRIADTSVVLYYTV